MSNHPTCATCRFWDQDADGWGECRRQAPRPRRATGEIFIQGSEWPETKSTDWCGEYTSKATHEAAASSERPPAPDVPPIFWQHYNRKRYEKAIDTLRELLGCPDATP